MRILVLYRHFWPDSPPYASMLRSILSTLAADGHDVTMVAEQPCYKAADRAIEAAAREELDGIRIVRLPRWPGIAGKALFPLRALCWALRRRLGGRRFDLVWTATIPPVVQGLAGRMAARAHGARFLYHMQDLYPELGAHSGQWRAGGMIDRLLSAIERGNREAADRLVTLSGDMKATALALGRPRGRLVVLNNFMLSDFDGDQATAPAPAIETERADGVSLIFAGNLGLYQGLDRLVAAMRLLAERGSRARLTLLGDGAARAGLMADAAGLTNVRFLDHRPFPQAAPLIAGADVGIVSLEPGIYRFAYPSKTLTYYGLGVPVLVLVEPESALAGEVAREGLGWVAPSDPAAIADAVARIEAEADALPATRARVAAHYASTAARDAVLARWRTMIAELAAEGWAR